jgi:ergothioneine biosynthesis protein EgtB
MFTTTKLIEEFTKTRNRTEDLCQPLEIEDFVVQPVDFVSPPKWHLGHSSWFFEEFLLKPHKEGYQLFDENFAFVFNSYYESVGEKVVRTNRGNLSRPTVEKIYEYRKHVTAQMSEFLENQELSEALQEVLKIGINHEQQHQELLMTDIKYILGNNPLLPAYDANFEEQAEHKTIQKWIGVPEGIYEIGHSKDGEDFRYDNEMGKHKVFLNEFFISNKLVSNGEFIEFMQGGGYQNVLLWHAEAWDWIKNEQINAPAYWHLIDGEWHRYTLSGLKKIDLEAPLTHISYYEAFAFAQWKELRLPTEFEWEAAQEKFNWGQRWEWTESAYSPYPGYQKPAGAIGEYNGKFMVNQKVLRGASIVTSPRHSRPTYRNFFHPNLRWQFTGLRLAK